MAFLKRLGYFLSGLAVGLIFLAVFFKNKSRETGVEFCYFPNCRVLKDIRSKPLFYSDQVEDMIGEQVLDSVHIIHFLREGDVDFGNSDTTSKPCRTYLIEAELDERPATMTVKNCLEKALVESVVFE